MRKIVAAALLMTLAGCAANTQVAQQSPVSTAAGEYKLIAVDGQAVPQVISTGDEVVSGRLLLHADGSFEMQTAMRTQMSSTQPLAYQRNQLGSFSATSIGVQLKFQSGVESSGAFFGRTLRFYQNNVEYLYLK
jgi:hypothetical protein